MQHVSLILQRSVGFQQWNGDGVVPATPGALRTRIHDGRRKDWFLVMEVDWRGSRFRCGDTSSWYYDKYARVFANAQCRRLPAQTPGPAACSRYIVMPLGLASAMENGEDVRGSPTRQQEMRGAQPCIGVVFGD